MRQFVQHTKINDEPLESLTNCWVHRFGFPTHRLVYEFFSCGKCPVGYLGDGIRCERRRNGCESRPCYPEVECELIIHPPYYRSRDYSPHPTNPRLFRLASFASHCVPFGLTSFGGGWAISILFKVTVTFLDAALARTDTSATARRAL